MSDQVRIGLEQAGQSANTTPAGRRTEAFNGYGATREVARQASVTQPMSSEEYRRASTRLDRALNGDKPLRHDVPRGFYFNVRV